MTRSLQFAVWVGAFVVASMAAQGPAQAATITFAVGDYDNTANTVTGTNAAPVYNNNQTTGMFRDVFWWGSAYNGASVGVGSPDFINSGPNLVSNGGSPARARPFGNDTALNFTGQRTGGTPAGATFLTVYDTTPGDGTATRNLFDATGGMTLSADVLFAPGNHSAGAGIVAMYSEGQDGFALVLRNGGGNNSDFAQMDLVYQQRGAPSVILATQTLTGNTVLGDTTGGLTSGNNLVGDHWYRLVMDVSVTGDSYTVNGQFWTHSDPENPNSALSVMFASLAYAGSLSSPGNILDLTNPGEIGLMAFTNESFSDGLGTCPGGVPGTGADPCTDNIGVSITNFSFPSTPVPLPAAAWLLLSGIGGLGVLARRRKTA